MRPRYEAQHNRDAEQDIADIFAAHCNGVARKLPGAYAEIDFALIRNGKVQCFFEVKDRTGWKPEYETVFLSVAKARALMAYERMGIYVCYVVRLQGVIHYQVLNPEVMTKWQIEYRGRTDRNDDQDVEPVFLVPVRWMKQAMPNAA